MRTGILIVLMLLYFPSALASSFYYKINSKENDYWWLRGQAKFFGEVVASACTIVMEDSWQIVDMGEVSFDHFKNIDGAIDKKVFFRFTNCNVETDNNKNIKTHIKLSFDGQSDGPDKYTLKGSAQGLSLQIIDKNGFISKVGEDMPSVEVTDDEGTVNYIFRVVRNRKELKAGEYHGVISFKLDYE
ncbi:type 1 fimbrial protein [Escherichia coli]